jgi:transposase
MIQPRKALADDLRSWTVQSLLDGEDLAHVAEVTGFSQRTLWRWLGRFREAGAAGLADKVRSGRPAKLSADQQRQVLGWIGQSPTAFGFASERWTAPRVAAVIARRFGVQFNARYLSAWLGDRGITPQVPQRQAAERDQQQIDRWLDGEWPRIKKRPANVTRAWFLPTKAAFC